DALQQRLHHDLRPRAVESSDHGQGEYAVPELYDWCRELEQLLLLPPDHFFAALLINLGRVQGELVEQLGCRPAHVGERLCVVPQFLTQAQKEWSLERQDEGRRLRRRVTLNGSRSR